MSAWSHHHAAGAASLWRLDGVNGVEVELEHLSHLHHQMLVGDLRMMME